MIKKMPGTIRRYGFVALALTMLTPALASAQRIELGPFVGYRFGGDFERRIDGFDSFDTGLEIEDGDSVGLTVGFNLNRSMQIELMYSRQDGRLNDNLLPGDALFDELRALLDVEVEYFHAGFVYQWTPGQVEPFIGISVGATRFSSDPLNDEAAFPSLGLGGGVKVMLTEHFGVRLDGRGFFTLIDSDDEVFCGPFDCFRESVDETFSQYELRAGVLLRF